MIHDDELKGMAAASNTTSTATEQNQSMSANATETTTNQLQEKIVQYQRLEKDLIMRENELKFAR